MPSAFRAVGLHAAARPPVLAPAPGDEPAHPPTPAAVAQPYLGSGMSIEYPYEQLLCQTQGGFLQTALSTVTRRSRSCSSPVLLRRVTPDRVLAFSRAQSHSLRNATLGSTAAARRDGM